MEIIILWLILAFVVAYLGSDRKIGGGWALLWALVLSPIVGFIIVAFSPSLLSLERDRVQKKQLEELETIRAILEKSDQVQSEQLDEDIDQDTLITDVPKLTTWQRIKYRL